MASSRGTNGERRLPVANDYPPDSTPTPRETPLQLSAVTPFEELQALASQLETRWQRALVVQARRMLRKQREEDLEW